MCCIEGCAGTEGRSGGTARPSVRGRAGLWLLSPSARPGSARFRAAAQGRPAARLGLSPHAGTTWLLFPEARRMGNPR